MYPQELIGKLAIRTAPSSYGDYSYSSSPIRIMAATESHVVFKYLERETKLFGEGNKILDRRWVDNNWTSYEDLMQLATEEHIELMKQFNQ